jgi:hypothetical protein
MADADRNHWIIPIPLAVFAVQAGAASFDRLRGEESTTLLWAVAMGVFLFVGWLAVWSYWMRRFLTIEYVAFGALLGLANAAFAGFLLMLSGDPFRADGSLTVRGRGFLSVTAALAGLSVVILLHGVRCRRAVRPRP